MYAKFLLLFTALFCAFILKAQRLQLSLNNHTQQYESRFLTTHHQVWDSVQVDFISPQQPVKKIGFYINYTDSANHHFLNLTNMDDKLILELGKLDHSIIRQAEHIIHKTNILPNNSYSLSIYRAPWVDIEHWLSWKIKLTDITSGVELFKTSLGNSMPFFGFGDIGFYTDNSNVNVSHFQLTGAGKDTKSLKPALYFADGMMLPRNKKFTVWGTAAKGEKVSVKFASKTVNTVADSHGQWKVELPPAKAGIDYEMVISTDEESIRLSDIAVGELWLASGQSNMEMRAWQSDVANYVVPKNTQSDIRFYMQQQWPSAEPIDVTAGKWLKGNDAGIMGSSAAALSFAIHLKEKLNVPIGIIQSTWGGTAIESWISRESLQALPEAMPLLRRYQDYNASLKDRTPPDLDWPLVWDIPGQSHAASYLYNGMLFPYRHLPISGVLWYQGESNTHRASQYRAFFRAFIQDIRKLWNVKRLPFIAVQLAGYDGRQSGNEVPEAWPNLRDIQRQVLTADADAALVNAFDLGDSLDIHPYRKWELGKRFAQAALHLKYDSRDVSYSGPSVKKVAFHGNTATVYYHKGTADFDESIPDYCGFEVAGEDKIFKSAKATLTTDGAIKLIASDSVSIVAVRYGWENYPVVSKLINKQGLAAVPFRTDDWLIQDQFPY